jgi:hypothetical protein
MQGDSFGMVGGEIFFQVSTVVGKILPVLGDKVVVEAERVSGMPFKFNAKKVQLLSKDLISSSSFQGQDSWMLERRDQNESQLNNINASFSSRRQAPPPPIISEISRKKYQPQSFISSPMPELDFLSMDSPKNNNEIKMKSLKSSRSRSRSPYITRRSSSRSMSRSTQRQRSRRSRSPSYGKVASRRSRRSRSKSPRIKRRSPISRIRRSRRSNSRSRSPRSGSRSFKIKATLSSQSRRNRSRSRSNTPLTPPGMKKSLDSSEEDDPILDTKTTNNPMTCK